MLNKAIISITIMKINVNGLPSASEREDHSILDTPFTTATIATIVAASNADTLNKSISIGAKADITAIPTDILMKNISQRLINTFV